VRQGPPADNPQPADREQDLEQIYVKLGVESSTAAIAVRNLSPQIVT
jgi:hypothetical protein